MIWFIDQLGSELHTRQILHFNSAPSATFAQVRRYLNQWRLCVRRNKTYTLHELKTFYHDLKAFLEQTKT